jgi:hypothetical protein
VPTFGKIPAMLSADDAHCRAAGGASTMKPPGFSLQDRFDHLVFALCRDYDSLPLSGSGV